MRELRGEKVIANFEAGLGLEDIRAIKRVKAVHSIDTILASHLISSFYLDPSTNFLSENDFMKVTERVLGFECLSDQLIKCSKAAFLAVCMKVKVLIRYASLKSLLLVSLSEDFFVLRLLIHQVHYSHFARW